MDNNELIKTLTQLQEGQKSLIADVAEIKKNMVHRNEFQPVKTIAYTLVGTLGSVFLLAVANLVIGAT